MPKIHPANLSQSALAARRGTLSLQNKQSSAAKKINAPDLPDSHVPVGSLGVPVIVASDPPEKLRVLASSEEVIRRREQARIKHRAKRAKRRFAAAIALIAIAGSFLGGFGYAKFRAFSSRTIHAEGVETPPSVHAMELLDRAVRAKKEERYDEAANFAAQSRTADPKIRGVDALIAEIAMKQQRPDIVELASSEALKRGHDVHSAKLLLALNAWKLRAQSGQGIDLSDSALRQTADVCADAPFEGDAYFFLGEMHRTLGHSAASHANFLSALHRMGPWSSASIVEAKMQPVAAGLRDDQGGQIVPKDVDEGPAAVRSSLTAWQLRQLGVDKPGVNPAGPQKALLDAQRTSPAQIRQTEQLPSTSVAQDPEAP